MRKALICHYRIGKTDGVSLEISKRKEVLSSLGWETLLLSGPISSAVDYIIPELEFDTYEVNRIKKNTFYKLSDFNSCDELLGEIERIGGIIERGVRKIVEKERPDVLMLHNIFSHGRHIAAAKAFFNIVKEFNIPTIATHHDFYWERPEYKRVTCDGIEEYLARYLPPKDSLIKHVVINKIARDALYRKRGIEAIVIPDTFDFSQDCWRVDEYNRDFLESIEVSKDDILILQATRIVERKGIGIAIDFVDLLNREGYLKDLVGKTLYNGKVVKSNSRVVLVLAGYAEKDSEGYLSKVRAKIAHKNVEARFISDRVGASRCIRGNTKCYSLWDCYVYADAISYPSILEGWGNQFIEAIFAKKPVVLYEYPVFKSDIRPFGYEYISLGDRAFFNEEVGLWEVPVEDLKRAADRFTDVLVDSRTRDLVEKNFEIAKVHHSYTTLRRMLRELLN